MTTAVEEQVTHRKRHRWESLQKWWGDPDVAVCRDCGLVRRKEFDADNLYTMRDGRSWSRYAPLCPPAPPRHDLDQTKPEVMS